MAHSSLFELPTEILLEISRLLPLKSLNALSQSCKIAHVRINPILYELDARSPLRWALYWSCIVGSVPTATMSIACGSSIDQYCDVRLLRAWEPTCPVGHPWEHSLLDVALRRRHGDVVDLLSKHGAKVTNWFTPRDLIANNQQEDFVKIITQLQAQTDINRSEDMSMCSTAIRANRADLFTLCWDIFAKWASQEGKERCFANALRAAVTVGSLFFVQAVLEIASDLNPDHANRLLLQVWLQSAQTCTRDGEAVFQYLDDAYPFLAEAFSDDPEADIFCMACRVGNIAVADRLLQLGPLIEVDFDAWPLGAAIKAGSLEMVKFLVTHRSPRRRPGSPKRYAAEYEAIHSGSVEILEYLLRQTGDLNTINEDGDAIHAAIRGRQTSMLQYMLSRGLGIPENAFKYLFFSDLSLPSIEMVSLLLEHGADPNFAETGRGPIPLKDIFWLLSESDPCADTHQEAILQMMQLPVSSGARFEDAISDGYTVARSFCSANDQVKQYLFQQQPILDMLDTESSEILYIACSQRNIKVVQFLLDRGANATQPNRLGRTPLELTLNEYPRLGSSSIEIAKLLLAYGDRSRFTTTCAVKQICEGSVWAPDVQTLRLLLDNDPSSAALGFHWGSTALHAAARGGNALCAKMMLEAGADVNAVDGYGQLPIDLAVEASAVIMDTSEPTTFTSASITMIRLLLEYGSALGRIELEAEHFAAIPELRKYIRRLAR